MTNRGIVPNSDLFRNNLTSSASVKARRNFTISSNININRSWSNNRPSGNRGTNPLQWAYSVFPNLDIRDFRDYWVPGKEGLEAMTYHKGTYENPWFLAYEVNNSFDRDRVFGNLKADWQLTRNLNLMGRYSLDRFSEKRETKIAPGYSKEQQRSLWHKWSTNGMWMCKFSAKIN